MFKLKNRIIRLFATSCIFLRWSAIRRSEAEIIVVTGSVGKTITRRAVYYAYLAQGQKVFSLSTDYVNEFGVVMSIFGIETFNFWSWTSWKCLLFNESTKGKIIIEIGADFRDDVLWFLRYFKPSLIVFTMGTDIIWTDRIPLLLKERMLLAKTVEQQGKVFVSSVDFVHKKLLNDSKINFIEISGDTKDIYQYPLYLSKYLASADESFVRQQCSQNRLTQSIGKNLIILKDFYKVTPLCLRYVIDESLSYSANKRILIMSEIRPTTYDIEKVYDPFIDDLEQFDCVLFIGDKLLFTFLKNRLKNVYDLNESGTYKVLENVFMPKSGSCDYRIVLTIKVSKYYRDRLENRLIDDFISRLQSVKVFDVDIGIA